MLPLNGRHVVRTADGARRISYRVLGDSSGPVILNCHGGLVSGSDIAVAEEAAFRAGMRIISPDRPGIGRTDRRPGGTVLSWAREDLTAVLNACQVDEVSVLGWSAGAGYALASAAILGRRVRRVAIVAGSRPMDDPAVIARSNGLDRLLLTLSTRTPRVGSGFFRVAGHVARRHAGVLLRATATSLSPPDRRSLSAHESWFAAAFAEAMTNPRGMVDEYRSFARPWGFKLSEVTSPVVVHQGDQDNLVPTAWARWFRDRLPDATLHEHAGHGHFLMLDAPDAVLRSLV